MARRPAVGDVHQQQPRPRQRGQLLDVRQHRPVGGRVLDRNEDVAVHRRHMNVCHSSQTLRLAISTATGQASATIHAARPVRPSCGGRP